MIVLLDSVGVEFDLCNGIDIGVEILVGLDLCIGVGVGVGIEGAVVCIGVGVGVDSIVIG